MSPRLDSDLPLQRRVRDHCFGVSRPCCYYYTLLRAEDVFEASSNLGSVCGDGECVLAWDIEWRGSGTTHPKVFPVGSAMHRAILMCVASDATPACAPVAEPPMLKSFVLCIRYRHYCTTNGSSQ
jgi:hypothetical protein